MVTSVSLLHAGLQVDDALFHPDGRLDHEFWQWCFGESGARLAGQMPQTKEEYSRKAIVGKAELIDVVEEDDSPWFLGRYGLILNQIQPFGPILNYPGARKLFAVPQTIIEQREDKTA